MTAAAASDSGTTTAIPTKEGRKRSEKKLARFSLHLEHAWMRDRDDAG